MSGFRPGSVRVGFVGVAMVCDFCPDFGRIFLIATLNRIHGLARPRGIFIGSKRVLRMKCRMLWRRRWGSVLSEPPAVGCYEFFKCQRAQYAVRACCVAQWRLFSGGRSFFAFQREAVSLQTGRRYEVCFKCQVEVHAKTRRRGEDLTRRKGWNESERSRGDPNDFGDW